MIPQILNQITLGASEQVLLRGRTMKETEKLPPGKIEMIMINTTVGNNYINS
jgi:hypothetical protein